jgi:signal transduction histidine kinase
MDVRLLVEGVARYSPTVEEAVYFCAREAIQNASKHAGAYAQVTLSLTSHDGGLELELTDDGPGFDPRQRSDGYGLASMRDRIAAVGGELEIISAAGQGSRVRATIPRATFQPASLR